jgi:hypothetical protein
MRNIAWQFETPNTTVRLVIEHEDMHPADSFEFQEDIDAVLNGEFEWFMAVVEVVRNGHVIGRDVLGGCAYRTIEEFYTSHRDPDPMNRNSSLMRATRGERVCICHYFPDMVRTAIADARVTLGRGAGA